MNIGRNAIRRFTSYSVQRAKSSSALPPSASSEEVQHFAQLANSWWDSSGPQRILHKMNILRLDYIRDTLDKYGNSGSVQLPGYSLDLLPESAKESYEKRKAGSVASSYSVLDVGCGGGLLAESLARSPFIKKVLAIDATPEVIQVAQAHRRLDPILSTNKKLEYKNIGIEQLSDNTHYDIVTLFEILEHVDNPSEFLDHVSTKIKKGGFLFMSTINRTAMSYLTTILFGEKILKIVPEGTHTWRKYINEHELREWFLKKENPAWQFIRSDGCIFIPGIGWKLTSDAKLGNYFMVMRKA